MAERLTMAEFVAAMGVDGNTARAWLEKEGIIPEEDRRDARRKWITREQAELVANAHDIVLQPLPDDMPVTLQAARAMIAKLIKKIELLEHENQELSSRTTVLRPKIARTSYTESRSRSQSSYSDMPEGLVGWRRFAQQHSFPETTVQNAIKDGRLRIIEGTWTVGRAPVRGALDQAGQAQFYRMYHTFERFQACPDCPHDVSGPMIEQSALSPDDE